MQTWTVRAQNLPEHAHNPIHTDAGARAAGFPAALVAGVTTYAYLTHPLMACWGEAWLAGGGASVRLRSPVFAGDPLACTPTEVNGERALVEARVGSEARAQVEAVRTAPVPAPAPEAGEPLPSLSVVLTGELGASYGARAGEAPDLYGADGWVHPAVWPALANRVTHLHVARGSWIHTRSDIRHHGLAHEGSTAEVRPFVVARSDRPRGEHAVLHVEVSADGRRVATLRHEAYVSLRADGPDT